VLVQQVLGVVEGVSEALEPCLQLILVAALLGGLDYQVEVWQDGGLQFLELTRHFHAQVG